MLINFFFLTVMLFFFEAVWMLKEGLYASVYHSV